MNGVIPPLHCVSSCPVLSKDVGLAIGCEIVWLRAPKQQPDCHFSWLHVSFQNKASNSQQHSVERLSHLKAVVVLSDTCDVRERRSIGVEKVPSLVRVVSATTTALRVWVIIVEGGYSGYLPCVSNSVHITDILMVMWHFIIYTSIRFPPSTPSPFSTISFLSVCIHTSTQLQPTFIPLFFMWIQFVKTISESLTGENCSKLTSRNSPKEIRYLYLNPTWTFKKYIYDTFLQRVWNMAYFCID